MRKNAARPIAERFWEKVRKTNQCWIWEGARNRLGYGEIGMNGKVCKAHRVAWELVNGEIPPQKMICHACDNPQCVRPEHLFLGDGVINMQDAQKKGRLATGSKNGRHTKPYATARGERNGLSKLSEDDVLQVLRLKGKETAKAVGRNFGVSDKSIGDIWRGLTWTHLSAGRTSGRVGKTG